MRCFENMNTLLVSTIRLFQSLGADLLPRDLAFLLTFQAVYGLKAAAIINRFEPRSKSAPKTEEECIKVINELKDCLNKLTVRFLILSIYTFQVVSQGIHLLIAAQNISE